MLVNKLWKRIEKVEQEKRYVHVHVLLIVYMYMYMYSLLSTCTCTGTHYCLIRQGLTCIYILSLAICEPLFSCYLFQIM